MFLLILVTAVIAIAYVGTGDLNVFMKNYPQISGFLGQEKNYLIILQNNNELRPAGGFISAYGILTFQSGVPVKFEMKDVYGNTDSQEFIEAPYPLGEIITIDGQEKYSYTFRDANYYPDFPKTAEELIKMYQLTYPEAEFDGVMAVNYSFIESILGVVGPVEIDGKTFNKENLFENIEFEVNNIDRHNIDDLKNRKNILKDLAPEIMKKIIATPSKWNNLIAETKNALNKKQIQVYFENKKLENLMDEKGWAGTWPENVKGDFLAVNEANIGGLKSDRYIKREITYHLKFEKTKSAKIFSLTGKTTIDIYHYGIVNLPLSGEYTGYFRTYVPKTAVLLESTPESKENIYVEEYDSYKSFGNIIKIPAGGKATIYYKYQISKNILNGGKYSLYIPKQSGADGDVYNVIIELPQGYSFESNQFQNKENIAYYSGVLDSDLLLNLKIISDEKSPFVVYQNIDTISKATVAFNEKMDKDSAEEIQNYILVDENYANEKTDSPKILEAQLKDNTVTLYITGMSSQFEEHYKLSLNNIKDSSGNPTDPGQYEITLVQRL